MIQEKLLASLLHITQRFLRSARRGKRRVRCNVFRKCWRSVVSFLPHTVSHLIKAGLLQYNQTADAYLCQERSNAQSRCLLYIFHLNRICSFLYQWITLTSGFFRLCLILASAKMQFKNENTSFLTDIFPATDCVAASGLMLTNANLAIEYTTVHWWTLRQAFSHIHTFSSKASSHWLYWWKLKLLFRGQLKHLTYSVSTGTVLCMGCNWRSFALSGTNNAANIPHLTPPSLSD